MTPEPRTEQFGSTSSSEDMTAAPSATEIDPTAPEADENAELAAEPQLISGLPRSATSRLRQPVSVRRTLYATALVVLVPILLAFGAQYYLWRMQSIFDKQLVTTNGNIDMVTALQWSSKPDGPLYVATRGSGVSSITRDGRISQLGPFNDLFATYTVSFHDGGGEVPLFLLQDNLSGNRIVSSSGRQLTVQGKLFAAVPANNGSAVLGINADPKEQSLPASGPPRLRLSLYRDLNSPVPAEVGEIFGIEDVRAVAALPGTNIVIAGDGQGGVFAIDASQQISGVNPDQYIRRIGQHEAAILEIVVSPSSPNLGMSFATLAADRTIRVWRGTSDGSSGLAPLGNYSALPVIVPGSTWKEEPALAGTQGLRELLSMSRDGSRVLANRGIDLVIYELPVPGESAAAKVYDNISHDSLDSPAVLSPDGNRLLAVSKPDLTVELVDLSAIGNGQRPLPVITSFTGLRNLNITDLTFDATGEHFLALSRDGTIFVQSIATPDTAVVIADYRGTGRLEAAISPDGTLVAVCDPEGRTSLHSASNGNRLLLFDSFGKGTTGVPAFDVNGRKLHVYDSSVGLLLTYSIRGPARRDFPVGMSVVSPNFKFSPDGRRYIVNFSPGLRFGTIDGQRELAVLPIGSDPLRQWVSDFTASRVAVLTPSGPLRIFRESESLSSSGPMPALQEDALRLTAQGDGLFVSTADGAVQSATLITNTPSPPFFPLYQLIDAPVLQFVASPDGKSVISARLDGSAQVEAVIFVASLSGDQDFVGLKMRLKGDLALVTGHGSPIQAMALSPDGRYLATASLDGRLRITDLALAKLVHQLPFAYLPTGPAVAAMVALPLDDSPYVPTEPPAKAAPSDFLVVYGAQRDLAGAQTERQRAIDAGLSDVRLYLRDGYFRNVVAFETAERRDDALPQIRALSKWSTAAYGRQLSSWCRSPVLRVNAFRIEQTYFECVNSPPAAK